MNWNTLTDLNQLNDIDTLSANKPVIIFKHSTRCSISSTALNRLERNWQPADSEKITPYYLDLLKHRDISNEIEARYGVEHESPQALVIHNGKAVYYSAHMAIDYKDIMALN